MLLTHLPVWQSAGTTQPAPTGHFVGQLPPQSIPVSVPSWTPLVQLGALHKLLLQVLLTQSLP